MLHTHDQGQFNVLKVTVNYKKKPNLHGLKMYTCAFEKIQWRKRREVVDEQSTEVSAPGYLTCCRSEHWI